MNPNHYSQNGMTDYNIPTGNQSYGYNSNYPPQAQYARPQAQLQSSSYQQQAPPRPQQPQYQQEQKRPKPPAPKKAKTVKRVKRSKSEEQDSDEDEGESEVESDPNLDDNVDPDEQYSGDETVPVATTTKSGRNIIKPKLPVQLSTPLPVKKANNKRKKSKTPEPVVEAYASCCENPDSLTGNELVLCDGCDKGVHQLCHTPNISTTDLLRDKWFCSDCTATRSATFVNLAEMTEGVNLTRENKIDHLSTLTPHALVNLIIQIEELHSTPAGLSIWPKDLKIEMEAKTAAEVERRRIELAEAEAIEAEYIRQVAEGAAAEELRGAAAATLTDLMGSGSVPNVAVGGYDSSFQQSNYNQPIAAEQYLPHPAQQQQVYQAQNYGNNVNNGQGGGDFDFQGNGNGEIGADATAQELNSFLNSMS